MSEETQAAPTNEQNVEAKRLDLLGELVNAYGRAHRRVHNVWAHDFSRRLYHRRLAEAKANGIKKEVNKDEPFPVSDASTNINYNGVSPLVAVLGGLGLLGGGAGAALWLAGVLGSAANPAPAITPNINPPSVNVDDVDLKIRWWVEGDGAKSQVSEIENGVQDDERK